MNYDTDDKKFIEQIDHDIKYFSSLKTKYVFDNGKRVTITEILENLNRIKKEYADTHNQPS